jgi:hypothetical protein
MKRRMVIVILLVVVAATAALLLIRPRTTISIYQRLKGRKTVEQRLQEFGQAARARMAGPFARAGLGYPPKQVTLLYIKAKQRLELYAGDDQSNLRFICSWPVRGASGKAGPKLRQGDNQVPEGIYEIESLNPNSLFHVAVRVGYPNAFDREMAVRDGRTNLGGDIMIHGKSASIGCLAMGDEAAEEIFTLVAELGRDAIRVILSPVDFRLTSDTAATEDLPAWVGELYQRIQEAMSSLPIPPSP